MKKFEKLNLNKFENLEINNTSGLVGGGLATQIDCGADCIEWTEAKCQNDTYLGSCDDDC